MSDELDIMQQMDNIDLAKVETEFPILATGPVTVQIQDCEYRRDTEKKGADAKPYLYVSYNLTQPWKTASIDGGPVKEIQPGQRGSTITERIYIGTYEDKKTGETKWYGVDKLALMRECVFGKAPAGTKFNPGEMKGQSLTVKLTFNPAPRNDKTGEVYGPRTEVTGYVRRKH